MATPHSHSPKHDAHLDPLTGEPGAHMLGTSIGAATVGAVTTALGSTLGGPVGGLIGAAIGPMLGGLAGKELAEAVELSSEAPPSTIGESTPTAADMVADTLMDSDPPSVIAPTAAFTEPGPGAIDKRAAEIARRQGRAHIAESDRRRAFMELREEGSKGFSTTPPPASLG